MKENLLDEVKSIILEYENIIRDSGEGFNIISILGMEENERYTHSAIITELLKPNKNHTFGTQFLEEFLKIIDYEFSIDSVQIIPEEYVGSQLGSKTYLDIVIKDKKRGKVILIENKIWAKNQPNQLERYNEAYKNDECLILYLTPFGNEYDVKEYKNYKIISYKNEITNWIKKCIDIAKKANNPFMENSLKIYLNIINKITNQSIYNEMAKDIFNELLESSENLIAAEKIAEQYSKTIPFLKNEFFEKLYEKLNDVQEFESKYGKIKITITEDSEDYLYLGIQLYDESGNLILQNDEFNSIIENLKNKFPKNEPKDASISWNTWFYVSNESIIYNNYVETIDLKAKIDLHKNLDKEVNIIYQEFSEILNYFKTLLEE